MMDAFSLHERRTAFVMPLRPGLAFGQKFLLKFQDQVGVLTMRRRYDSEFFCEPERFVKFFIRYPKGAFVSQEDFETTDAAFDNLLELLFRDFIVARHAHVEGVIAGALALGFAAPQLERSHWFVAPRRADHFDEGRCSAHERG